MANNFLSWRNRFGFLEANQKETPAPLWVGLLSDLKVAGREMCVSAARQRVSGLVVSSPSCLFGTFEP